MLEDFFLSMSNGDPMVQSVTCPNCSETVTIYYEDRECSECGANITDLQSKLRENVRTVKQQLQEAVETSQFELKHTNLQKDVVRADIEGSGPFHLDSVDMSSADLQPITDRQQDLSSLIQTLRSIGGVADVEQWYAESNNRVTGSKYGMEPDLSYRDEGNVTLLVGTNVSLD